MGNTNSNLTWDEMRLNTINYDLTQLRQQLINIRQQIDQLEREKRVLVRDIKIVERLNMTGEFIRKTNDWFCQ